METLHHTEKPLLQFANFTNSNQLSNTLYLVRSGCLQSAQKREKIEFPGTKRGTTTGQLRNGTSKSHIGIYNASLRVGKLDMERKKYIRN